MNPEANEETYINFDAAEVYLRQARHAHRYGFDHDFIAARKLLMVALGVADAPPVTRNTFKVV